ncbi:barstar family protein [Streptomyces nigrescens]
MPTSTLLPLPGLTFTAWMNGAEMRDPDGVFQQFWDNLKLPDYFGWNFPALNDCLRDLNWLSSNQYVLFIEEAHKVLSEDPAARTEFFEILLRAGAKWGCVETFEGCERARFQVTLECGEGNLASMSEVIATSF